MKKIVVIEPLVAEAYRPLESRPDIEVKIVTDGTPERLEEWLGDADAMVVRTAEISEELLAQAKSLRTISRHGVGYDNIPVKYCTSRGIAVTIVGDVNSISVAEHTLFLILAAARAGIQLDQAVRRGAFLERSSLLGLEIYGRTLLILGYGRIGKRLAEIVRGIGLRVVVFDPYFDGEPSSDVEIAKDLHEAIAKADILSLHMPLTPETRNLIGAAELDLLRSGAIVVNAARGGLLDEEALIERIRSGHLHGAGLDTFLREPLPPDSPLLCEPRIVLSPHSAALTVESLGAMGRVSVQNAIDGIDGCLKPELVVNPQVLLQPD